MTFDINHIRITGTVEQFDTINTRTGTPMVKASVRCFKELFIVVAFKELASFTILTIGDRVEVKGRIQSNDWTDKDGNKRYGFQVVATEIGSDTEGGRETRPHAPPEREGVMEYSGGPF